jgi:APA family basic amino acid/polyamine antiporter
MVLRYRSPDIERGFRTPGMPIIPLIGVGSSIWLTTYLTSTTWLRFGVWLVIGLVIYGLYGYRHSLLSPGRARSSREGV